MKNSTKIYLAAMLAVTAFVLVSLSHDYPTESRDNIGLEITVEEFTESDNSTYNLTMKGGEQQYE